MKIWNESGVLRHALVAAVLLGACSTTTPPSPPVTSTTSSTQNGTVITADMIGRSRGAMPLSRRATDPTYGYSETNPVKIGGGFGGGSDRTYQYLNSLRGPGGEAVRYDRVGTCCPFKAPTSPFGEGLLEIFTIAYPGLGQPKRLYFNWYEEGEVLVPAGLTTTE
ncbi:MAG: hypothetical protein ACTHQM_23185 [Thermoanaerobaculia bacterium]